MQCTSHEHHYELKPETEDDLKYLESQYGQIAKLGQGVCVAGDPPTLALRAPEWDEPTC